MAPLTLNVTGLPAGLSFDPSTCLITGTPTTHGSVTVSITATDSQSPAATQTTTLTLDVAPAGLALSPNALLAATVGQPYSQAISASGGVAPLTLSVTGLPAGLSFDPSTGLISGTPTAHGPASIAITATDSQSPAATQTTTLTLDVAPAGLALSPSALSTATVGQPYSQAISASGGVAPLTLNVTGLPAGLSFDPSTGLITGTPTAHGAATVSITVSDSQSPAATQATMLTLDVAPAGLVLSPSALPDATLGEPYRQAISATGGVAPLTLNVTGLPDGLSFDPSTGLITGTPVATAKALTAAGGTVAVTLSVQDSSSPPASQSLTLDLRVLAAAAPAEVKPVPALGTWGLGLLGTLTAAATLLRRRKPERPSR